LINPEDTKTYPYPKGISQTLVDQIPAGLIYGMASWIDGHKDAVTRFLQALQMAIPIVRGSPLTLAKTLMTIPAYGQSVGGDADKALVDVTHAQYHLAANDGLIPKSAWSAIQDYVIAGGSTFVNKTDPKWSYENFVDMSPLEAANRALPSK
jgi:ABC-type nitrate/sulfonate/bicarbonate transport system substrate-binding protein